jgi:hypothetical protein
MHIIWRGDLLEFFLARVDLEFRNTGSDWYSDI